jgi:tRNA(Leu) C34 or U34 (ribose-2'-O)-methylase TrmL
MNDRIIIGKKSRPVGITPSIAMVNPKYTRNIANAIRAASCFGIKQLWYTGNRIKIDDKVRLPREERMKGYKDVQLIQYDYFIDQFEDVTPVAIEVRPNSELLTTFEHPKNPLYIFGPEDGSIDKTYLHHCHRFVIIPSCHCTNLAAAIYIVLYDRLCKMHLNGEITLSGNSVIQEDRFWNGFNDKINQQEDIPLNGYF